MLNRNSPHTLQALNVPQTAYLLEGSSGQELNSCFTSTKVTARCSSLDRKMLITDGS